MTSIDTILNLELTFAIQSSILHTGKHSSQNVSMCNDDLAARSVL